MTSSQQIWVSPKDSRWVVKSIPYMFSEKGFDKKLEAKDWAIEQAKFYANLRRITVEVKIQRMDGVIEESNTYGPDSYPPKG